MRGDTGISMRPRGDRAVTISYAHGGPTVDADVLRNSPLRIRPARPEEDLEILAENLGQHQRAYFADRLSRQKIGNGVLLTAWWDDHPVGDAYLWLEDAEEPELRKYLPGVPLLTHVEVREDFQSRGIGTRLIAAAEATLADPRKTPNKTRYQLVALAVERHNVRARKLYERLGYRIWQHTAVPYVCCAAFDDGAAEPEVCHVMIKDLVPAQV
jgi:GNAT superfamily N-acetyltransferase